MGNKFQEMVEKDISALVTAGATRKSVLESIFNHQDLKGIVGNPGWMQAKSELDSLLTSDPITVMDIIGDNSFSASDIVGFQSEYKAELL